MLVLLVSKGVPTLQFSATFPFARFTKFYCRDLLKVLLDTKTRFLSKKFIFLKLHFSQAIKESENNQKTKLTSCSKFSCTGASLLNRKAFNFVMIIRSNVFSQTSNVQRHILSNPHSSGGMIQLFIPSERMQKNRQISTVLHEKWLSSCQCRWIATGFITADYVWSNRLIIHTIQPAASKKCLR